MNNMNQNKHPHKHVWTSWVLDICRNAFVKFLIKLFEAFPNVHLGGHRFSIRLIPPTREDLTTPESSATPVYDK